MQSTRSNQIGKMMIVTSKKKDLWTMCMLCFHMEVFQTVGQKVLRKLKGINMFPAPKFGKALL